MRTALIVDDAKAMRGLLRLCLERAGYDVSEASDGMEGLRALETSGGTDLIFLDWNMPNMDGLAFLKVLRQESAHSDTPVVMVSTVSEKDRLQEALSAGANEYLMKPFTEDMVAEKLRLLDTGLAAL